MNISELMTRKLITVAPDDSVEAAVQLLRQRGVRHLLVMKGDRLAGPAGTLGNFGNLGTWVLRALLVYLLWTTVVDLWIGPRRRKDGCGSPYWFGGGCPTL